MGSSSVNKHIAFAGGNYLCSPNDLHAILEEFPQSIWYHRGGCGFDRQVEVFARENKILTMIIKPDVEKYGGYAQIKCREKLAEEGILLIACWDGAKVGETWHIISHAQKKGKTVRILNAYDPKGKPIIKRT